MAFTNRTNVEHPHPHSPQASHARIDTNMGIPAYKFNKPNPGIKIHFLQSISHDLAIILRCRVVAIHIGPRAIFATHVEREIHCHFIAVAHATINECCLAVAVATTTTTVMVWQLQFVAIGFGASRRSWKITTYLCRMRFVLHMPQPQRHQNGISDLIHTLMRFVYLCVSAIPRRAYWGRAHAPAFPGEKWFHISLKTKLISVRMNDTRTRHASRSFISRTQTIYLCASRSHKMGMDARVPAHVDLIRIISWKFILINRLSDTKAHRMRASTCFVAQHTKRGDIALRPLQAEGANRIIMCILSFM